MESCESQQFSSPQTCCDSLRFIVKNRLTIWVQLDLERLWLDDGPIVFVGLVSVHRAYLFDKIVFVMSARGVWPISSLYLVKLI